ncbi:MAG: pirin family protein [Bacteroidales bacterium]
MKCAIDKAEDRGHASYDWLETYHTFSFAGYYNPNKIHFGALRVLNDDKVMPHKGFGMHKHENMEIISIPLLGHLKHQDSMGNVEILTPGVIQVMSAGSGIMHAEYNDSEVENVEFLQIWILPKSENTKPTYNNYDLKDLLHKNRMTTIVAPDHSALAMVNQNAWVTIGFQDKGEDYHYKLHGKNMGVYVFVIHGHIEIENQSLSARDGISINETEEFIISVKDNSYLLVIEVPMIELK